MAGSRRSPPKCSDRRRRWAPLVGAGLALLVAACTAPAGAESALRPCIVEGDALPASLTGEKGDPERGRAIVVNRQVGLCLLCHSGPFPSERFQGTLAPDLKGAGTRSSEGQLRLRIVDSS